MTFTRRSENKRLLRSCAGRLARFFSATTRADRRASSHAGCTYEPLESRLFLSADTATLVTPPGVENVTATSQTDMIAVVYFGSSVDTTTFGNGNLVITGGRFPGTITYTGQGTVDSHLIGLESIADYTITENVPTSDNGDNYTLALAANQVSDGNGGTFPTQALGTFQVQIPVATAPPITLLNADGSTLAPGSTINFGNIAQNARTPMTETFGIRNDGATAITVSEYPNEPFEAAYTVTSPSGGTETIQPGQTQPVTIGLALTTTYDDLGALNTQFFVIPTDPSPYIHYNDITPLTLAATVVTPPPRIVTTIDVTAHKPVVFTDATGSRITARLTGPGTATLGFGTSANGDIKDLSLQGTTLASSLTITPVGGGDDRTSITGNVNVTGSLSHMTLTRVDLPGTGSFTVSGAIGNLKLGNVTGLEQLEITGLEIGHPATHMRLIAGALVDTTIDTSQPIASIKVASWSDTHAFDSQFANTTEQILTPSLDELTSAGDFTVGIDVFNNGSLGHATIGGSLGADPWIITGNASNLRIGAVPAGFSGTIGGKLFSLTVAHDDAGTIAAGQIGTILIRGNLTGAKILAGANLGTDGRIGLTNGTGQDSYSAGSIKSLQVLGTETDSIVTAGLEPADGLFDNAGGTIIGDTASVIETVVVRGGIDSASRFVAGAFKSAHIPNKLNPTTDSRFVIPPVFLPE